MSPHRRSIGALARESGLTVSALRFYDAAGVLRPARVDPGTGYRWYDADQVHSARLIAGLRAASMPLPDICATLAARGDPAHAAQLLDGHLRRLEDGLADARAHLATVRELLITKENQMTALTVDGTDLAAAVAAVRFAVSSDPHQAALNGVLFDFDGDTLRLVASDRYRLAVATVATRHPVGPAISAIAPTALLDHLEASEGDVQIHLTESQISVGDFKAEAIDALFPDYQQLLQTAPTQLIAVSAADLVQEIRSGPTRTMIREPNNAPHEMSLVLVSQNSFDVVAGEHPDAVGFNQEFLLEAVQANGGTDLVLAYQGPIGPLAIHDAAHPENISLLMPVNLG